MLLIASGGCGGGGNSSKQGGGEVGGSKLSVTPNSLVLQVGQTGQITAKGYSGTLVWTSGNDNCAKVESSNGATATIKAIAAGKTDILVEDEKGGSATCQIAVNAVTTNLTLSPSSLTLAIGETERLTAQGYNGEIIWTSDNEAIAKIESVSGASATVKAIGVGEASIIVEDGNEATAACQVTVNATPLNLTLTPSSLTLNVGASGELTAKNFSGKLTWTSNNTAIAKIENTNSASATIKALLAGSTSILVKDERGLMATCQITINKSNVEEPNPTKPWSPVVFQPGEDHIVVTQIIGAAGGTIQVVNTGTPIDGVKVVFPAGALPSDTTVTLGYNTGTLTPNYGVWDGKTVVLSTSGVNAFGDLVKITIPYKHENNMVPLPSYINKNDNRVSTAQDAGSDYNADTLSIVTLQEGAYTIISGTFMLD